MPLIEFNKHCAVLKMAPNYKLSYLQLNISELIIPLILLTGTTVE